MRGLKKLGSRSFWPAGGSMFSLVLLAQGCPFMPTDTQFPLAQLVVVAEPANFQLGATSQARATLKDADGNVLTGIEVAWSSSNGLVATVTPNGGTTAVVTGVGAGSAMITASAGGESGSAAVQVTSTEPPPAPPPPPPVSSVVVALTSSSLNAAGTTQATATLRDADGNELSGRAVSWSSSDEGVATVSASGGTSAVVTAVAPGSAQIIAASEGKSGSATVTVTDDGTASDGYPNQPPEFSVVTERVFDLLTEAGWSAQDFIANGLTTSLDATAPKSAPTVGQIYFPAGFEGGSSPANTWKSIQSHGFTKLYVSFWIKISSNWYGHPSLVNKLGLIWTHDAPVVIPAYAGSGSGPLLTQIRIQDVPGGAANFQANLANLMIERGQWVRWEILLINNTGDNADGQIHWWINGTKAGQYSNVKFGTASQSKEWEEVRWDPIWGGLGSTVPQDMYMWMDHWYVSGAR